MYNGRFSTRLKQRSTDREVGPGELLWFFYDGTTSSSRSVDLWLKVWLKCSSDPSHFIFEINVGKSRIRHTTTLKLNDEFLDRLNSIEESNSVVLCRIRLFPTLVSKIKRLGSELPLRKWTILKSIIQMSDYLNWNQSQVLIWNLQLKFFNFRELVTEYKLSTWLP